jgi:hypothetical protein
VDVVVAVASEAFHRDAREALVSLDRVDLGGNLGQDRGRVAGTRADLQHAFSAL